MNDIMAAASHANRHSNIRNDMRMHWPCTLAHSDACAYIWYVYQSIMNNMNSDSSAEATCKVIITPHVCLAHAGVHKHK